MDTPSSHQQQPIAVMYAWTRSYWSQSLWLFAFIALFETGCNAKDAKTQAPGPDDVEYGALRCLMRAKSPGEALDFDEAKVVHQPKPLTVEPLARPQALAQDVQSQAEETSTQFSKSFHNALQKLLPASPHMPQTGWLRRAILDIQARLKSWTKRVWQMRTQQEPNGVSPLMLGSTATLAHAKSLAHRVFASLHQAAPDYPIWTIVLPVLFLVLVAAAFFLPIENWIARSMRQSLSSRHGGNLAPGPRGSVRRTTPAASPFPSRPATAAASISHAPPTITTPYQVATPYQSALAALTGPSLSLSPPQHQQTPQGTPRASNASHLPWSACRRLTTATIPHLCAELVVPDETECNLLVPEPSTFSGDSRISINDTAGVPVFHAALSFPSSQQLRPRPNSDTRRLTLWSAIDGLPFASCRDAEVQHPTDPVAGQARPALTIFHHSEVPFGILRPDSSVAERSAYSILTHSGREIFLYRAAEVAGMRAEDESGRLLAMVIGIAPRSIRIGPQVDAGLMTLALLGIDLLEHDAKMLASHKEYR